MKSAGLHVALLLAVAFNASAMTTADNASRAPASKAVPGATPGKITSPPGVTVRSAQRAASEAQPAKPKR